MLMYSALHIMQCFSDYMYLDVFTLKIRRKFFDFDIFDPRSAAKYKVKSMNIEMFFFFFFFCFTTSMTCQEI